MINKFWQNILRYPSFIIISITGLILVIVTPLINLFKNNKLQPILVIVIILVFVTLYFILINMLSL